MDRGSTAMKMEPPHEFFALKGANAQVYRQLVLILAVVPLLYMRKKERPRRSLSVWMVDTIKILGAYFVAEIATMIMVSQLNQRSPFLAHFIEGMPPPPPPPPGMDTMGLPPPPPLHRGPPGPHTYGRAPPMHRPHDPPGFPFHFMGNRLAVNGIMLNLVEIFPGIGLVFCLYVCLLKLALTIRLRYLISKGHILTKNELQGGFGFINGHYGYPLNKVWAIQQTVALTISIFIVRAFCFQILNRYADYVINLEDKMFWWTELLGHSIRDFVLSGLLVFVLHSAQAIALDHMLKIHHKSYKTNSTNPTFYQEWGDDRDIEAFPLEEVNLQIEHSSSGNSLNSLNTSEVNPERSSERTLEDNSERTPTTSSMSSFRSTSTNNNRAANVSYKPFARMDDTHTWSAEQSNGDDGEPATAHDEAEDEAASEDEDNDIYSARDSSSLTSRASSEAGLAIPTIGSLGLGNNRYGMVTASILNMAAANATVNARPNIFGVITPAGSGNSGSDSSDVEDGAIDTVLPSYDDSQRQQQELLRDSIKAEQQDRVIRDLKR